MTFHQARSLLRNLIELGAPQLGQGGSLSEWPLSVIPVPQFLHLYVPSPGFSPASWPLWLPEDYSFTREQRLEGQS
jgi:hypothetical protein